MQRTPMSQGMTPQSREEISVLRIFPRLPEAMNRAISATKIFLKMQKKNNLFVITKTKDLAKYIITVTEKSPKKFRFTLVVRLQNYILDAMEEEYPANASTEREERLKHQKNAKTRLSISSSRMLLSGVGRFFGIVPPAC